MKACMNGCVGVHVCMLAFAYARVCVCACVLCLQGIKAAAGLVTLTQATSVD